MLVLLDSKMVRSSTERRSRRRAVLAFRASLKLKAAMKPIPGYEGYFADELGNVYSMRPRNRLAKPPLSPRLLRKQNNANYNHVSLRRDGETHKRNVSIIVLETFVGPRPSGMWACHGPNGSLDDSIGNLYWATPSRNALDMHRDGTMRRRKGEEHGRAKLNNLQVRVIRKSYSPRGGGGLTTRPLACLFGVSKTTIAGIVNRRLWRHLS